MLIAGTSCVDYSTLNNEKQDIDANGKPVSRGTSRIGMTLRSTEVATSATTRHFAKPVEDSTFISSKLHQMVRIARNGISTRHEKFAA